VSSLLPTFDPFKSDDVRLWPLVPFDGSRIQQPCGRTHQPVCRRTACGFAIPFSTAMTSLARHNQCVLLFASHRGNVIGRMMNREMPHSAAFSTSVTTRQAAANVFPEFTRQVRVIIPKPQTRQTECSLDIRVKKEVAHFF